MSLAADLSDPVCPLCDRVIPPGARASRHHLVPKLKGGGRGETVLLHQICHSAIHASYSETDLARRLHTIEALKADPKLSTFLSWVSNKPGDFHAATRQAQGRSQKTRAARARRR